MIKNIVIAAVVSTALIDTSWAFGQETAPSRPTPAPGVVGAGGGNSFFVSPDATVTLLRTREVQTELKLEDDKTKKLDEINAEANRERSRLSAEYSAKMRELNQKSERDALGLLSDAQRQRAEQLKLQRQGTRAFATTEVAEKLGLTPEQRTAIGKLTGRTSSFGGGRVQNPNPNTTAEERLQQARDEAAKRTAENREKILALLTPEQRAKWSEMTGEPFKFPTPTWPTTRGTRSSESARPTSEKKAD